MGALKRRPPDYPILRLHLPQAQQVAGVVSLFPL
jgi:hypothetical protein